MRWLLAAGVLAAIAARLAAVVLLAPFWLTRLWWQWRAGGAK